MDERTEEFYKTVIRENTQLVLLGVRPISNIRTKSENFKCSTKYGDITANYYKLVKGNIPTIQSAVDKTLYFMEMLKSINLEVYNKLTPITEYKSERVNMVFTDKYGELSLRPRDLLDGSTPTIESAVDKTSYYINRAKEVHGDTYNYDKVEYTKGKDKVVVTCKSHGDFKIRASDHLKQKNKLGCKACAKENRVGIYANKKLIERNKEKYKMTKATLYIIEIRGEGECFFKVGTTKNTIKSRFEQLRRDYEYKVVYQEISTLYNAIKEEQKILEDMKKYKYKPNYFFGGYTECLSINPKNKQI